MSIWQYLQPDILDDASPFIKLEIDSDNDVDLTCHSPSFSRPPSVPPLTEPLSRTFPSPAISSQVHKLLNRQTQDVRTKLNPSTSTTSSVTSNINQYNGILNGTTPAQTLQNASINQSTSLRTFTSPQELATHYGIPHFLPPVPRTTPQSSVSSNSSTDSSSPPTNFTDFSSLKSNYLSMLSDSPDNTKTMVDSTVFKSPEEVVMQEFLEQLVSPEFRDAASFEEFLTSPLLSTPYDTPLHDFGTSPNDDSPFTDFLTTPLLQDDAEMPLITGPADGVDMNAIYASMPLFGGLLPPSTEETIEPAAPKAVSPLLLDKDKMHLLSPTTPALPSIDPASVYPSPKIDMNAFAPVSKPGKSSPSKKKEESAAKVSLAARRNGATGTRKGVTPSSLVPLEAPTQTRKYSSPSATSRKEVPAVFERKRKRAQAKLDEDEDQDELDEQPLPPNATEREQIEWKRRQNTLAARKSRKRKLEHQQYLEDRVEALEKEAEVWRTRTETLQSILRSHGIHVAEFPSASEA